MPAIDTAEVEISSLQGDRDYQQDAAYWTREVDTVRLAAAVARGVDRAEIAQLLGRTASACQRQAALAERAKNGA